MSTHILDKIAKVLAKAEATDNEHEADAFLTQAQAMATRYSIDLAVARRHTAKTQKRETPTMRTVHVGSRGATGNRNLVNLFLAIAGPNDVTCNIAHDSTYVIAFGFPSDIDVVEALHAHLSTQMVTAATAYLRTGAHKEDTVWDDRRGVFKPINGRTARLSFYTAFTNRITVRLDQARQEATAKLIAEEQAAENSNGLHVVDPDATTTGTELVLADKKAEVASYYKDHSTARGTWRGARGRVKATSQSARRAGAEAGSRARLSGTAGLPGARTAIG